MLEQVDDAIGDLAGGRYYNKETIAAITLGMGTNAAYVETAASVPKWNDPLPKSGELVSIYNASTLHTNSINHSSINKSVCFRRLLTRNGEASLHPISQ